MDIRFREGNDRWIVEIWCDEDDSGGFLSDFDEPYPDEVYEEINQWCIKTFGYHARTSYHIFEFKKRSDLDWFLMRWA